MAYSKSANRADNNNRKAEYKTRILGMTGKAFKVIGCYFSVKDKSFSCKCVDSEDASNIFNLYGTNASITASVALECREDLVARFELKDDKYIEVTEVYPLSEYIPFN